MHDIVLYKILLKRGKLRTVAEDGARGKQDT